MYKLIEWTRTTRGRDELCSTCPMGGVLVFTSLRRRDPAVAQWSRSLLAVRLSRSVRRDDGQGSVGDRDMISIRVQRQDPFLKKSNMHSVYRSTDSAFGEGKETQVIRGVKTYSYVHIIQGTYVHV